MHNENVNADDYYLQVEFVFELLMSSCRMKSDLLIRIDKFYMVFYSSS